MCSSTEWEKKMEGTELGGITFWTKVKHKSEFSFGERRLANIACSMKRWLDKWFYVKVNKEPTKAMDLIAPPWKTVPVRQPYGSWALLWTMKGKKHFMDELSLPKSQTKWVSQHVVSELTLQLFQSEIPSEDDTRERGHGEAVGLWMCFSLSHSVWSHPCRSAHSLGSQPSGQWHIQSRREWESRRERGREREGEKRKKEREGVTISTNRRSSQCVKPHKSLSGPLTPSWPPRADDERWVLVTGSCKQFRTWDSHLTATKWRQTSTSPEVLLSLWTPAFYSPCYRCSLWMQCCEWITKCIKLIFTMDSWKEEDLDT